LGEVLGQYRQTAADFVWELIYVNDGSRDKTEELLVALAQDDPACKYISFSRNFGKEAAMLAGLTYASGDAVLIMDADLQHPPELIPQMLAAYAEGYDQVVARRNRKGDGAVKSLFSKIYYKLVNKMIDVKLADGVGDFRLLSRKAADAVLSLGEYNRFSKGIFSWIGFKQKEIEYENVTRGAGESKWSFKALLQYGIDGVLSFNNKPLRLMIGLGLFLIGAGALYLLGCFILILLRGRDMPGYFTLITAIVMMGGVQLLSIGVVGEYVGRIYYEVKKRPGFIIDKTNIHIEK